MQRTFYTFLMLVVALLPVACDNTGTTTTFKGIVTDTDTKQPLTGVSVMVMPMNLGGETSESGSYSIEMPRTDADVYLVFSYPGYEEHTSANMPLSPKRVNEYTLNVSLKQKVAKAVLSSQIIDFGAQQTSVSVLLSNPGTDTLRWNLPSMYFPQWLEVSPAEGVLAMNGSQEIIFLCDRTGLPIGDEQGSVQLLGGQSPLDITVKTKVEGALLSAEGTVFHFGEEEEEGQTVLNNNGNIALEWALEKSLPAWLSWNQSQGVIPAGESRTIKMSVDRSAVDFGSYTHSAKIVSNGGDTSYLFSVVKTRDLIQVKPSALDLGTESTKETFTVSRLSGVHAVPFSISCNDANLTVSPVQGTVTDVNASFPVSVTLNRENIPMGQSASDIKIHTAEQDLKVTVTYATSAEMPSVRTDGTTLNSQYGIQFKGTLLSNGGGTVRQHGHCWGTVSVPDLGNATVSRLGSLAEGESFVSDFDGTLQPGIPIYYRAYATNEMGTAYGEVMQLNYAPAVLEKPVLNQNGNILVCRSRATGFGTQSLSEHGFCWNRTGSPDISRDAWVKLGQRTAEGLFISQIPDLERGHTYYVKAYAINASGLVYSEENSIELSITVPVIETGSVADEISYYTARLHGDIQVLGSETILGYGHCWSTSQIPTLDDSHTDLGVPDYPNSFTSQANGLIIGSTYYFRAYIRTSRGIYYGNSYSFSTLKDESVVVPNGLLMYITTDASGKAVEWTGHITDLVVSSGVTYNRSNKPAGTVAALSFNGSSGYIMSPSFNPLSGVNKGTINFWLRFRSTMSKSLIYPLFGSVSPDGAYVELRHNGTDWILTLNMGPGKENYVIPLPSVLGIDVASLLGTSWHMLSIVSDGSKMSVFMDGSKLVTQDLNMTFGVQNDFVIGANALGGSTLNTFLTADMACLRFYNIVVSDEDITRIFNAGM